MSNEPIIYEVTEEHFAKFKAWCDETIALFGLKDWHVRHGLEDLSERDTIAQCAWDVGPGKDAIFTLSTRLRDVEPTDKELRRCAFHEVCHLLLADVHNIAVYDGLSRKQRERQLDRAFHAVIRRLENAFVSRL
jgi:hypothetical protein